MIARRKTTTNGRANVVGSGVVTATFLIIIPTAQADTDLVVPEVEVIGYRLLVGTSDAASQGQIGGELLDTRPVLRPAEVLEYVPGLVVTQHSGDGKANQYFLRGYNLDHGTDLAGSVDGVPVNMPTNAHGQGYMDLNFLIPELIDHIDYRKGPYYAEYGDFSAAGAVDISYRTSLEHDLGQITLGSWGYKRALVAGSRSLGEPNPTGSSIWGNGTPTVLGAVELLHENGPWDPPEGLDRFNGLLRLSDGSKAQGWSIDGIFYKAHWDSTDQVPLPLIQSGQLGRFQALDPTDGGDSERAVVSGEWHGTDDQGYSKALVFAEHYQLQLFSDFTFFENHCGVAPNPNLPCDQFQQWENRNLFGTELAKGWNHTLFAKESTTEVGLQVRHDEIHVGLNDTQSRAVFQQVRDDQVSETATGVYVKNTTVWTPWFRSLTGMRADRVDMNVDAQLTPQNSGSAHGQELSPKLSLIFGPWAKTEFFVNAGKGFHSNDARGVTQTLDPTDGAVATPVPALVSAKGAEIGARTEAVRNLQSSIAFWTLYSNSEVQYGADSNIGSTSPNGATRRYGVEWNNHWTPTHWLLFDADLAWTHARYAYDNDNGSLGNLVPNAVSEVANIGVTVFEGPWSGGVTVRYFGPYPLTQDGSLTAPSSLTTNVRVQNQLSRRVAVALDVLNVFDRKNYDIVYGQDFQVSPASVPVSNGITVHPAEPLQVRLTLKVEI
jgi:TonB dependent receptor-like, beta-barrel/TonB-dependent Receptor Plug Domain